MLETIKLPCGQCIGCRLDRSQMWALRCMHEAHYHEETCMITLTYSPQHLPEDGGLDKTHFQNFMKSFRKSIAPKKVRFFHCGEYGDKFGRPHYHALIFGYSFPDRVLHKYTEKGHPLYKSNQLAKLWKKGYCAINELTFESAAYVARYILKKITGEQSADHYTKLDQTTGEIWKITPEYTTCSRRPGIAHRWLMEFTQDVYPHDNIHYNGKQIKTPRYYDSQYEILDPDQLKEVKAKRKEEAKQYKSDNTPERLAIREKIKAGKLCLLPRNLEEQENA